MEDDMSLLEQKPVHAERYYWGRHRLLRILFAPMLRTFSKPYRDYRFMSQPKEKRQQALEPLLKKYEEEMDRKLPAVRREDVVGRDPEFNLLWFSFKYHVMRDKSSRGVMVAPAKAYIVAGESGSGKTYLLSAFMREAYRDALKDGVLLNIDKVKSSEIVSKYMGESSKALAERFGKVDAGPSIIVVDEAQQLASKTSSYAHDETGVGKEYLAVEGEILQVLDHLKSDKLNSIIILATNRYEHIGEEIRRRVELIDLDRGMTPERLLELAKRLCAKYGIFADPEKILTAAAKEFSILGKNTMTFSDVNRIFETAVSDSELPVREGISAKPAPITMGSILSAVPRVMAYSENEKTDVAKDSRVKIKPDERYADIGGLDGVKEKVIQEITLALKGELAAKMGYRSPRGFLFYGAPGSGKTLLAKAISGETSANFFYISATSVLNKYVGSSEQQLRDIFSLARKEQPSIIFIDEIDAIGRRRGSVGDNGASANVLTALLTEMDGFATAHGRSIVIGATNLPDSLDPALLDRFTRKFEFTYPRTTKEKIDVLSVHMRRFQGLFAPDVTTRAVFGIFVRKSFSPRVIADTMDLAARMRANEIVCAQYMASEGGRGIVKEFYKDALERIGDAAYEKVAKGVSEPQEWPLTLSHIQLALDEITKNESYETVRRMQQIYLEKESRVGRVYGVAEMGPGGQYGSIGVITANLYKKSNGSGTINVYGNAGEGSKESCSLAVMYLRQFMPEIADYDVSVHFVTPGEGGEEKAISGPSAGQAVGVAIATEALEKIRGISLPVRGDVTMTGKVEQKLGLAGWVGGIHPKETAAKIDVSVSEGFKVMSVPAGQLEELKRDYPEYAEMVEKEGLKLVGAADLIDNLAFATGKSRAYIEEALGVKVKGNGN